MLYVVWKFQKNRLTGCLQGIFNTEELAQQACAYGDCYMPIELNKYYEEEIDSELLCSYKYSETEFISFNEWIERNQLD